MKVSPTNRAHQDQSNHTIFINAKLNPATENALEIQKHAFSERLQVSRGILQRRQRVTPYSPIQGLQHNPIAKPNPQSHTRYRAESFQQRKTSKRTGLVLRLVQLIKEPPLNRPQSGLFKGVKNVEKDQTQGEQTRKITRGSTLHFLCLNKQTP
jgi:hypothetical protein